MQVFEVLLLVPLGRIKLITYLVAQRRTGNEYCCIMMLHNSTSSSNKSVDMMLSFSEVSLLVGL